MGSWRITADLLAASRFVVSPLTETVAALTVLDLPAGPWQQAFHAGNRAAYDQMLDRHPTRRDLVRRSWQPRRGDQPGWMADFLGSVPLDDRLTFEAELDDLAGRWDDEAIRSALYRVRRGRLPDTLLRPGLRTELVALLQWLWTATLEADWPRRERVLRADVVSRTATLATRGWSGVVETLGVNRKWLGDERLQINRYDLPERDLSRARSLMFVPAHSTGSWVNWDEPTRYAIVYPVTGALAPVAGGSADGVARLIGANRARVLEALGDPCSTTALAALFDLPVGAVGNHLRVLLDAGLVLRRRAGREVLYWRSALGDALIGAAG